MEKCSNFLFSIYKHILTIKMLTYNVRGFQKKIAFNFVVSLKQSYMMLFDVV